MFHKAFECGDVDRSTHDFRVDFFSISEGIDEAQGQMEKKKVEREDGVHRANATTKVRREWDEGEKRSGKK